ncbi:hypothetical protein CPC08DRAFT_717117 [Agrocybe pediades]|nr:hypothetical protein CPC08DRAFT_717117 [Agrocybe pediades]
MDSPHDTISLFTSNISRHILHLALDDRQILTALLRWDPSASDRLTRALRSVNSPWQTLSLEEEYALILRDLESSIQQAPPIWAEVATINIRLDSLSARISQVAPGSHSVMGHVRAWNSTETSFFHNAQHIMIMGGNFTMHSTQHLPENSAPASSPPLQLLDERSTMEIGGEIMLDPLRRIFVGIKRAIKRIAHKVDRAVRMGWCT